MMWSDDIGSIVVQIFRNQTAWIGKTLGVAAVSLTGNQIAEAISKSTGQKVLYEPMTIDEWMKSGKENADITGSLFMFYQLAAGKIRDLEKTREVNPSMRSFDEWLLDHHLELIPAEK